MNKISKKLSMTTILKIKEQLERDIIKDSKRIEKIVRNCISGKSNSDLDISEIEALKVKKENQLLELKLIIQKANMKKHRIGIIFGKSNFYYIYRLSVLVAERKRLFSLDELFTEVKSVDFECDLKHKKVLEEQKKIESEIQKIELKLSKFNNSHKETVELYSDLNLI